MNLWIQKLPSILAVSAFCLGSSPMQISAIAQPIDRSLFAAPPLPAGIGAPGQRSEAASRLQGCKLAEKELTAIVPVYPAKGADIVWGTTTTAQPTLWFYVPYASTSAFGEFVLENAAQQQTIVKVPLAAQSGIMRISLADHKASLETGKPYRWYFNIYCRNSDEVDGYEVDSYVEGSITRQPLSATLQDRLLQTKTLPQRIELFAANGMWHDAVTIAADLKCARSSDPNWVKLLQAVELRELAQEPIVTCRQLSR